MPVIRLPETVREHLYDFREDMGEIIPVWAPALLFHYKQPVIPNFRLSLNNYYKGALRQGTLVDCFNEEAVRFNSRLWLTGKLPGVLVVIPCLDMWHRVF